MNDSARFDGPRQARPEDIEAILATVNLIFRTSRGRPPDIQAAWPHIYNAANAENIIIVSDGDKVVASTAIWPNEIESGQTRIKVGGINCVATLPEYRKHGLGAQVMRAAHERMREMGCEIGLLDTMIINWYRNLGWERAGCAVSYQFNRSNITLLPKLPADVEVRPAGEEALGEVLRIRSTEKLGGVRTPDTFRMMYAARGKPQVVLAHVAGKMVGYLFAHERSVSEWGGPAQIVAGLIRARFESCDAPAVSSSERDASFKPLLQDTMTVACPSWGHPLIEMLEELRVPFNLGYLGMTYVLDPRGLLDAFKLDEVAIEEKDDVFTLSREDETCTVSRTELSKLLFGPEMVSGFGADVFPLPLWQWSLEHV